MSSYALRTAASVDCALERMPAGVAAAMVEFITGPLLDDPCRVGKPGRFELEHYRIARRGQYRIIYRIVEPDAYVLVVRISHRADAYRRR